MVYWHTRVEKLDEVNGIVRAYAVTTIQCTTVRIYLLLYYTHITRIRVYVGRRAHN